MPQEFINKRERVQAVQLLWTNWEEMCAFINMGRGPTQPYGVHVDHFNRPIRAGVPYAGERYVGDRIGLVIPSPAGPDAIAVEGNWVVKLSHPAGSLGIYDDKEFRRMYTPILENDHLRWNPPHSPAHPIEACHICAWVHVGMLMQRCQEIIEAGHLKTLAPGAQLTLTHLKNADYHLQHIEEWEIERVLHENPEALGRGVRAPDKPQPIARGFGTTSVDNAPNVGDLIVECASADE